MASVEEKLDWWLVSQRPILPHPDILVESLRQLFLSKDAWGASQRTNECREYTTYDYWRESYAYASKHVKFEGIK
jgi:hypothetical protein